VASLGSVAGFWTETEPPPRLWLASRRCEPRGTSSTVTVISCRC